ncbi:MAG: isochorismatase family cysteine hydrolase [Candidatus Altiarchaeota archaeon]
MSEALLIVDMQRDVVARIIENATAVTPNIKKILKAFRKAGKPVVHIARVHRADGADVELFRLQSFKEKPFLVSGTKGAEFVDDLKPEKGEYVVEKQRFSGFFQTELQLLLARLKVDTVVLAGVQTPNCVRATVVDAIGYDLNTVVLTDATGAKTKEIHDANLLDMRNMGARMVSTDEYVREIAGGR